MNYNFNSNENIFIAGSNGMVGSAIKKALLENKNKNNLNFNLITPSKSEINLCHYEELRKFFDDTKPSIVINAAGRVGGIYANINKPFDFIFENLKIQTNLIELSFKFKIKTLLFLGSSCIYPKYAAQPIKEEYLLTNSLEKTNEYYAIAKIAGIKLCQALNKQYNFNSICLMPTNLYGPGDNYSRKNSHVIPGLIRKFYDAKTNNQKFVKCWGTGNSLREFLYVDDLAEACIFILDKWHNKKESIPLDKKGKPIYLLNVGSPFELSIRELASKISKAIGYEGEILWDKTMPDGTPRKKLDTSKINSLGYAPKTNIDDGIFKTLIEFEKALKNNTLRD